MSTSWSSDLLLRLYAFYVIHSKIFNPVKPIAGTVNWGIIGCGDVCEVKSGPAFNKVAHSRLVAVMRRNGAKAKDFAARHGVPCAYSDASELIHDPEVNAIYVATPPVFHEQYTRQALLANKPVYVEKPVAVDAASCHRMLELERKVQGYVSVAHYRRALSLFQKVRSVISDGVIGNIRLVQLRVMQPPNRLIADPPDDYWRVKPEISGGGLFHDLSPHQLDIVYWIFGAPISVRGRSSNRAHLYEAPDLTVLEAGFVNGIHLDGLWDFSGSDAVTNEFCEITGDKGKVRFSFFSKSALEVTTPDGTQTYDFDYPLHIQQPMIDAVVKFFRGEGPNPCGLREALVTMKMMDVVLRDQ